MSPQLQMALWLAAAGVGIVLSALFSGIESGIYVLSRIKLRLRSESGEPRARMLFNLLRNRRSLLGALLIGNNIANYLGTSAIAAFCSYTLYWQLRDWQITIVVPLIIAPLLLLFGEILPKNIFRHYADRYTYKFARMLKWSCNLFTVCGLLPMVNALTWLLIRATSGRVGEESANLFHPRQQIGHLLAESRHEGTLTPYQSALVERVMNLHEVKLEQAMVPLGSVQAVPCDISRDDLLAAMRSHSFSRVPAFDGDPDNIVGIVNINEVMMTDRTDRPVSDFIYDTVRVSIDTTIVHAIFALQSARRAMGIVTDKAGRAVGAITIKDLVEEITGEIEEW